MAIKDINGLKIKGGIFDDQSVANLGLHEFNDKHVEVNRQVSLIYGENASGKTTLSRAVCKAAGREIDEDFEPISANFVDVDGNAVELSAADKDNVHVFNEDFIYEQVHLKKDGLNTLALFGQQNELADSIEALRKRKNDIPDDIKNQQDIIEKAKAGQEKIIENIVNNLKQKGGWANRYKDIKGKTPAASSVKKVATDLLTKELPTESADAINNQYENIFEKLSDVQDYGQHILFKASITDIPYDRDKITDLLRKEILIPALSEREKCLIEFTRKVANITPYEIKREILDNGIKYCPYCMRKIDSEARENVSALVSKLLNREELEHVGQLRENISFIAPDMDNLEKAVSVKLIKDSKFADTTEKLLALLKETNELILKKINYPYKPLIDEFIELEKKYGILSFLIEDQKKYAEELNEKIAAHNANVDKQKQYDKDLTELNLALARIEINAFVKSYNEKTEEQNSAQDEIAKLKKEQYEIPGKIDALIKEAHTISVAPDVINNYLRYIYHSDNGLKVNEGEDFYTVTSHGSPISPKASSTGERNILALCYFFASSLKSDMTKENNEPELYVIDDPISSFDKEKALGIMSLIKFKLMKLLKNSNAKVVIMTHNILNFIEFEKMFERYNYLIKRFGAAKFEVATLKLTDGHTEHFNIEKKNFMREMLETLYSFACGEKDDAFIYIGNLMRRVTEAFGSFQYEMDFEMFQDADTVIWEDCDKELAAAIQSAMIRMCLHGGSHTENNVRYDLDTDFIDTLSLDEAKYCAKVVIVMMYVLNRRFILTRLCDKRNGEIRAGRETQILAWQQEIHANSPLLRNSLGKGITRATH